MASKVQISNKQRRIKVDSKWFKKTAEELFRAVLDNLKDSPVPFIKKSQLRRFTESGILSVALVSKSEIQKLNKEWRGKDYATDVLSFPLELDFELDGIPFEMGELIISPEKAKEQAEEYGHSFEREMCFLFVHGCLHVLGFDHMTKADEKEMFGRQKKILNDHGYIR